MTIAILEYLAPDGASIFGKWFAGLDPQAAVKVTSAIDKIERGLLGDVESVGGGVSERKIDSGPGYRIYFGSETDGRITNIVILLCGGTKKGQNDDVAKAKEFWKDYKSRKRRGAT
jgi:putative addiction module killer protein